MSAATKAAEKKTAKAATQRTITIRLKKGLVATNPNQRATVNGLGLKRQGHTRTLENTPSVRGMIKKVLHLVEVVNEVR